MRRRGAASGAAGFLVTSGSLRRFPTKRRTDRALRAPSTTRSTAFAGLDRDFGGLRDVVDVESQGIADLDASNTKATPAVESRIEGGTLPDSVEARSVSAGVASTSSVTIAALGADHRVHVCHLRRIAKR